MLIDQQSASLGHDLIERQLELRPAIAPQAMEDVARQAFGVNANQQRAVLRARVTELEYHRLFRFGFANAFEAEYAKSSEAGRKVRFSDLI